MAQRRAGRSGMNTGSAYTVKHIQKGLALWANIQMEPVSYGAWGFRGGHGGGFRLLNPFSRVEPGDRAKDNDSRRRKAKLFTAGKFRDYLTTWVKGCCCAKEWEKGGKK